ncbi:MAG: YitT family protein [Lachnospiraceae bacterium]|nr:YitT family protein [Lachnospiraceae bacterium]
MARIIRNRERKEDYLKIIFGTLLMALSANLFYTPANMVPGGFTGLAIILQETTRRFTGTPVPVWLWNIVLNVPLILIAIKIRGWKFMRRTLLASLLFSLWLYVVPEYGLAEQDPLLTAVIGGALMGAGLGYVFLGKATTGGTDTLAALIQRAFPYLTAARIMPILDGLIILLSVWIFGFRISMYAIITVVLCGRIADKMIGGSKNAFLAYIISEKYDDIAQTILQEMDRGVTMLPATGVYTNQERPVLLCAVSTRQAVTLRDIVSEIDPKAFFVLTDASEIRGEGFQAYSKEEF